LENRKSKLEPRGRNAKSKFGLRDVTPAKAVVHKVGDEHEIEDSSFEI
jgi:hypothetical protein